MFIASLNSPVRVACSDQRTICLCRSEQHFANNKQQTSQAFWSTYIQRHFCFQVRQNASLEMFTFLYKFINCDYKNNCCILFYLTFCWPCIMQWFLVIAQLDAQSLFNIFYLFIVLYMFRAFNAHHQEKQIVSIQLLVIVTPCWWQCIDMICFSWWWAWHARNM